MNNDQGNSLTPIDPPPGGPARPFPSTDPYNMYFTPDGHYAIVVEERQPGASTSATRTRCELHHSLSVPCSGVDHMDFTADGRYLLASCEFGGSLIEVDVRGQKVVGRLPLPSGRDAPGRQALP